LLGPSETLRNPWVWLPPAGPWYEQLAELSTRWRPSPELRLDSSVFEEYIKRGAERRERWLLHPCLNSITYGREEQRIQRDFQLALWLAAHGCPSPGTVNIPEPLWAWSPDGGNEVAPGVHDLAALGAAANREWPFAIAYDIWCRSTGFPVAETCWAARPPSTPEDSDQLQHEALLFLRALTVLKSQLGGCHEWLVSVAQVAVPLRGASGPSRSGNFKELPGLIFFNSTDEMQILEAMVHEAAHKHFFFAEVEEPLVDPSHTGTYRSPLRPEPRPLRGVFLAYHALAYMCALYADALRADMGAAERCTRELANLRPKLLDAEETMTSNRRFLTPVGSLFLDSTVDVGRHSQGPW
jgi:hypothetical protein